MPPLEPADMALIDSLLPLEAYEREKANRERVDPDDPWLEGTHDGKTYWYRASEPGGITFERPAGFLWRLS